jgi:MatE
MSLAPGSAALIAWNIARSDGLSPPGSRCSTVKLTSRGIKRPHSSANRAGSSIAIVSRMVAPCFDQVVATSFTNASENRPRAPGGRPAGLPLCPGMLMQQMANSSMGGAVASAIARAIGAGRHADASAIVIHGIVIAVGMAIIFASVLLIGGPAIYTLMGGTGDTLAATLEYSNPIFAGALAYWLLSTLTSVVRGAGQATVLAVVYLAAEILHIALVPILMFGIGPLPPFGITGAGVATVTSFTVSSAVLAWYVASGRTPSTCHSARCSLTGGCLSRFCASALRCRCSLSLTRSLPSPASLPLWAQRSLQASVRLYDSNICCIRWRSV